MNDKLRGTIIAVGALMNLGCIATLAAIGLKRNKDAYDARMECIGLELKNLAQDIEIHCLKRELTELKTKYEIEEEA